MSQDNIFLTGKLQEYQTAFRQALACLCLVMWDWFHVCAVGVGLMEGHRQLLVGQYIPPPMGS